MIQTSEEVAFQFRYAFTNHTDSEYTLPSAEMGALMRKLPGDAALDKLDRATWDGTIRIPPNQSIAVTITVPFRFSDYNASGNDMTDENLSEFAGRRLKDIDGLAFFDYASKYKIQMAKNWDTPKKQETKSNFFIPPDKGDTLRANIARHLPRWQLLSRAEKEFMLNAQVEPEAVESLTGGVDGSAAEGGRA